MKIWILSSDSEIASTKSLVLAARRLELRAEVLDPMKFHFEFERSGFRFFYDGTLMQRPSFVLPRLGWSTLDFGLRLCFALEKAGVPVFNSASSCAQASDKLTSAMEFAAAGLAVPKVRHAPLTMKSDEHLFERTDFHVFKTLRGSQGYGVTWQTTRPQSLAQVDAYRNLQAPFLTQELILESQGQDVRAFLVADQVLGAMKRKSLAGDLRSNLHQGGTAEPTLLSHDEQEMVRTAGRTLGLYYSGVDFLRTSNGPLLLEANPFPGFEGINQISGRNLAEDLLNRLTTSS